MLSDFGLAVAASEVPSGLSTSLGLIRSIRWSSPELMDGVPRSTASDVWAWADLLVEVMKESVPYSWIKEDLPVIKAIMKGVLPEPKSRLLSPVDLWSVTRLCWEISLEKRATAVAVLKELDTLITTVESYSTSEKMTPTSEFIPVAASRSRQRASKPKSLGMLSFWNSPAENARQYYERFKKEGDCADLDAAIRYQWEALKLRPSGHTDRSMSLHNIAYYLDTRYAEDGNRADLDAAITYQEEALQLRPPGHIDHPISLRRRPFTYTDDRNRADIHAAITYQEEELPLLSPSHSDRSLSLHDMALYIYKRYKQDGNRADLDAAITYQEEALQLRPPGHSDRSISL
ncbi:hypothetical protein FRB95_001594 [Tulasnella sp. JGI-2019a]|nr:hypothetical protein FRB95_001594 [Tulasnella sp. JGI-2019a]